jgi:hypothetical protein
MDEAMNPVTMEAGAFAEWAEATFEGVSFDSARFWDMQTALTDSADCPFVLRALIRERHAIRPAAGSVPNPLRLTPAGFESEWVERGSSDGE